MGGTHQTSDTSIVKSIRSLLIGRFSFADSSSKGNTSFGAPKARNKVARGEAQPTPGKNRQCCGALKERQSVSRCENSVAPLGLRLFELMIQGFRFASPPGYLLPRRQRSVYVIRPPTKLAIGLLHDRKTSTTHNSRVVQVSGSKIAIMNDKWVLSDDN